MITLEGIALPADLQWIDEFSGHGVGQIITPTLTGSILVEETAQTVGRVITLQSNGGSWMARTAVEQMAALAATPLPDGDTLSLDYHGRAFDVVFDRSRGPGFKATEVRRLAGDIQGPSHKYTVEVTLLTA